MRAGKKIAWTFGIFVSDILTASDLSICKFSIYNFKTKIRLVADVRGGYVRIEQYKNKSKRRFLGINGNDESNFINSKGRKQGRFREDCEAVTHFRILRPHLLTKDSVFLRMLSFSTKLKNIMLEYFCSAIFIIC